MANLKIAKLWMKCRSQDYVDLIQVGPGEFLILLLQTECVTHLQRFSSLSPRAFMSV